MRGRITADEDAWLYHKWKPEVDVYSLLQATLPPGLVEDEVDTYEALALASSFQVPPVRSILLLYLVDNEQKQDMCAAFCILHDVLCEGNVACICL